MYSHFLVGLFAATFALGSARAAESLAPSEIMARRRGPEIFNAVTHAMRQWGSSLHHNGMSFFLATVPEGVLLHHGNNNSESPTEPDWLAYEIEHAEGFARGRHGPPPGKGRPKDGQMVPQFNLGGRDTKYHPEYLQEDEDNETQGYLHVYRTSRPLQFLYIDGMSGGKTAMGTLDSQDYLLRGNNSSLEEELPWDRSVLGSKPPSRKGGGPMGERQRAEELCELCREWGLQGVIRMEAGFEIIKCDFSDGLEEIQALQRPNNTGDHGPGMGSLEVIRGLAERYQGIGAHRTVVDFSSMVSAFFFPVNLTNSDQQRPDLPRLTSTSQAELAGIRSYLTSVIHERLDQPQRSIDWQDVADMIVGRYADRIQYMAEEVDSIDTMAREVNFLLTLFIDHSKKHPDIGVGIDRCSNFYLRSIKPQTEADRLILEAFAVVTHHICATLFRIRDHVVADPTPDQLSLAASTSALRSLMDFLEWTRFKRCPPCDLGSVCTIPMWPMGTVEQYRTPRCTNGTNAFDGDSYWGIRPGPPGDGRRRQPLETV
ncbi:hypothetical protein F4779DRAFT_147551 [Xylariaceae sp. FL0662B]|nr:hypothetical protein F4779DRAFT_147551 [Xylariaceae sp. FL0662B]